MFRKQKAPPFWRAAPVSITYTFLSRSFRKYYFYSGNKSWVIARRDGKGVLIVYFGYFCFRFALLVITAKSPEP